VLPGRVGLDAGRDWWEQAWGVPLPETVGLGTTGTLTEASEGRLQGLILLGADPLNDFPDRTLAKRGLDGAGFVVAIDCFLTESSQRANVILPSATYAERPGTFTNLEGRIVRLGQKITPPGAAWSDWMIAVELAFRLGGDLGFDRVEGIWEEIERFAPSHRGITGHMLASMAARDGIVAPLDEASTLAAGAARSAGGPVTEAGSGVARAVPAPIDPMADPGIASAEPHPLPAAVLSAPEADPAGAPAEEDRADVVEPAGVGDPVGGVPVAQAGTPLDGGADRPPLLRFAAHGAAGPVPKLDGYSLRLVAARTLWDNGTLVQRSSSLAGLPPPLRLRVNPYDLDRLGVASGGQVRAISPRTSMVLEALADGGVPRGSASLTFNLPGQGAADLIDATAPVTDVRLETV
jgi:predicted molibdopterin-dependent oxidoreductase YjgC